MLKQLHLHYLVITYFLFLSSLILLLAMVGTIVLTLKNDEKIKLKIFICN